MSSRDYASVDDEFNTNSNMRNLGERGTVAYQNQRTYDEPLRLNRSNRQAAAVANREEGNCQDETRPDQFVHDELDRLSADRRGRRELQHNNEQSISNTCDTMGCQRISNVAVLPREPTDLRDGDQEQPSRLQPTYSLRTSKSLIGITPGSPLPGAYDIPGRAYGERPTWAQQGCIQRSEITAPSFIGMPMPPIFHQSTINLPEEEEQNNERPRSNMGAYIDEESQAQLPMENARKCSNQSRTFLFTILLFAFGLVALTSGFMLNRTTGSAATTNNMDTPCSSLEPHPNVKTQCECFGRIERIPDTTMFQYKRLQTTLGLHSAEDSLLCDAHNLALLLLSSMDTAALTRGQLLDRYAMNLFFLSSGGPRSWKRKDGWLNEERDACTWSGIDCDRGRITKLDLFHNGLNGTLVSELGLLDSLTYLKLSENGLLSGAIPSEVGRLNSMVLLELQVTSVGLDPTNPAIQYAMPSEIGLLTGLESLGFPPFVLVAALPSEFGNLRALTSLRIEDSSYAVAPYSFVLSGPLPIWDAIHLRDLFAPFCSFSGSIPGNKLGLMTGLTNLDLRGNKLTGTIPSELGLLSNLEELSLGLNLLTGTIPSSIGGCSALRGLFLDYNDLSGTIPDDCMGRLKNLESLNLVLSGVSGDLASDSPTGICELSRSGTLHKFEVDCSNPACDDPCCPSCSGKI